eukprot:426545-Prorocentrum_minimum.AAC.1
MAHPSNVSLPSLSKALPATMKPPSEVSTMYIAWGSPIEPKALRPPKGKALYQTGWDADAGLIDLTG